MHDLTLAVVFGEPGGAVGWVTQENVDQLPPLGMRASFRFGEHESMGTVSGEVAWEEVTHAQVLFAGENPDGRHLAFLYGGPEGPSEEFTVYMRAAQWTELETSAAEEVLKVCASAPPMAAVHDVLLVVGERGEAGFQVWNRSAIPTDPVLPVFGQRVLLDAVDGLEEAEVPEEDGDLELGVPGSAAGGVVVVTLHSGLVEPGFGSVVFWTPALGDVDEVSMVSAEWELLNVPDAFDPDDFQLKRRCELALRTRLTVEVDEHGGEQVVDAEMVGAAEVDPEDYELLPDVLALHCHAAREMIDMSALLDSWREEEPKPERPAG